MTGDPPSGSTPTPAAAPAETSSKAQVPYVAGVTAADNDSAPAYDDTDVVQVKS
jgi:hypothetical protein